jgi:hypothetical protein
MSGKDDKPYVPVLSGLADFFEDQILGIHHDDKTYRVVDDDGKTVGHVKVDDK